MARCLHWFRLRFAGYILPDHDAEEPHMLKQFTAATLIALTAAAMACSAEVTSSEEELGTTHEAINSCSVSGLEWKPFVAQLAYDAAVDFGTWEFTTHLKINGDRLAISDAGYTQCYNRGRSGCPMVTAGLSAQEGNTEIQNGRGRVIMNPMTIRSQLVTGFQAQQVNEANAQWIGDSSEVAPYNNFQSPTRTGLAHSLSLTNCAATVYADPNYTGASTCLRVGTHRMSDLGGMGNDKLSSIKVRSGMKVTLYEHDQFNGASATFTSDNSYTTSFNDRTSSLVVSANDSSCSAFDTYKVTLTYGGDWTKIRAKLVTLGYMRGNDILDVRIDLANQTIDVDPYNVDFVPPSQIGGTTYGVAVKSETAETWRSTEDPSPSIFPVGGACKKKAYGSYEYYPGTVRSSGMYRFCFMN
jgi:hypothetical protein